MRSKAEALARRICREVVRQQASRHMLWISIEDLTVAGRDRKLIDAALKWAEQQGWLTAGGEPAHSVILTEYGRRIGGRAGK
jgi:hypothetical protein